MALFFQLRRSIASCLSRGLATPNAIVNLAEQRLCRRKLRHYSQRTPRRMGGISSSKQGLSPTMTVMCRRYSSLQSGSKRNVALPLQPRCARPYSMNSTQSLRKKRTAASMQQQSVRFKCGRENCQDPCDYPPCPPFNVRWPSGENKLHNIYENYWDGKYDDCCDDPCKWAKPHPRFDDIYLQESDKAKRRYMRTWTECPMRIKQKRICCYDGDPPEICFRPRKERPQTACPPEPEICDGADKPCQKIKMPCCCNLRKPQNCKPIVRSLLKCKKFCTPFPSFSECIKAKLKPRRPTECLCLNPVPMCDYYVYWRKRILSRSGEKC